MSVPAFYKDDPQMLEEMTKVLARGEPITREYAEIFRRNPAFLQEHPTLFNFLQQVYPNAFPKLQQPQNASLSSALAPAPELNYVDTAMGRYPLSIPKRPEGYNLIFPREYNSLSEELKQKYPLNEGYFRRNEEVPTQEERNVFDLGPEVDNFGQIDYAKNVPNVTRFSDQDLAQKLKKLGLPNQGSRQRNFETYMRVQNNDDLLRRLVDQDPNNPVTVSELYNLQSYPTGVHDTSSVDTPVPFPQQAPSVPAQAPAPLSNPRAIGTGSNPMQLGSLPAANSNVAASAAQAAAPSMASRALTGASMFAQRALPVIALASLAGNVWQASQQNREQQRQEKRMQQMRS